MTMYEKAIVSSGHPQVSEAAAIILQEGGNAFDAIVAAGFASTVVEQALTSLGGGGFLIGHSVGKGQNFFFDFFVDTPGLGQENTVTEPHFFPVTVQFPGALQIFNVGLGSVAVPGVAKGLLHIHERLGSMKLQDIIAPACALAQGHILNQAQAIFLKLLYPIMTHTHTGRELLGEGENYVKEGDVIVNTDLAAFFEQLAQDKGDSLYHGEIAQAIVSDMEEAGGLLTLKDLSSYQVLERKPLQVKYRGLDFYTSPPPSLGGTLIGLSLSLFDGCNTSQYNWGSREHLQQSLLIMQEVERLRQEGVTTPDMLFPFLDKGIHGSFKNIRLFSRGTTHISVADKNGNCASMTCSNGEGSGYFAPQTGVMLNNMMGEDDLHPEGFHNSPAGQRVASMMSPSFLLKNGTVKLVIGSGGSKRIRTAITQVLTQVVDFDLDLAQAVAAPRMYWDGECLQVEPGFDPEILKSLDADINIWNTTDVYFGGVHAVIPGKEGAGDARRGGAVRIV